MAIVIEAKAPSVERWLNSFENINPRQITHGGIAIA
jgi:hypothetical protein